MAGTRAEFEGYMGTWVTSRGRKVFIRDGEGIAESIIRYNKNHGIKTTRHDVQASIYEYDKMNKQQKFINSVPKEVDEKEYNQNAEEFRDAFNLEDEYNKVYENPNYYEEMQGTNRLKAKVPGKEKIDYYLGKHESLEDKSQHLIDLYAQDQDQVAFENKVREANYPIDKDIEEYYDDFPLEDVISDLNDRKHKMETGWYPQQYKASYQQWNEATQKYIEKRIEKDYESGNYNPMEEFSDTMGDGLTDLQRKALYEIASDEKITAEDLSNERASIERELDIRKELTGMDEKEFKKEERIANKIHNEYSMKEAEAERISKGIPEYNFTGRNVKDLRKALRSMKPYTDEIQLGNRVIKKTTNGYAVRGKDDYDDPMTDYSAFLYGWKEKWIIDEAVKNGDLTSEEKKIEAKVNRFKERKSNIEKPLEELSKNALIEKIVDDQIKRGIIKPENRQMQINRRKGKYSKEALLRYFK